MEIDNFNLIIYLFKSFRLNIFYVYFEYFCDFYMLILSIFVEFQEIFFFQRVIQNRVFWLFEIVQKVSYQIFCFRRVWFDV